MTRSGRETRGGRGTIYGLRCVHSGRVCTCRVMTAGRRIVAIARQVLHIGVLTGGVRLSRNGEYILTMCPRHRSVESARLPIVRWCNSKPADISVCCAMCIYDWVAYRFGVCGVVSVTSPVLSSATYRISDIAVLHETWQTHLRCAQQPPCVSGPPPLRCFSSCGAR